MSVEEIIKNYDPKLIQSAAQRIAETKRARDNLSESRWSTHPLVFDSTTLVLPTFDGLRPLAVTLHSYGLYIEPIYVHPPSGGPEAGFALHIEEREGGLRIYVEDAFDITLQGSYDMGFVLKARRQGNTEIKEETGRE